MIDTQKLYNRIYNQLKGLNLKYEDLLHRKKSKSEALDIFIKTMLEIRNKTIDTLRNETKRLEYQLNHIRLHPELYSDDSSVIENTKYNLELIKNELKRANQEKVKIDYLIIETSITIDVLNKLMQESEYKEHIPKEIILLKDEIINKTIPIINEATNRLDESQAIIKKKDDELKESEAKYMGLNREYNILITKYQENKNNNMEWVGKLLPEVGNKSEKLRKKFTGVKPVPIRLLEIKRTIEKLAKEKPQDLEKQLLYLEEEVMKASREGLIEEALRKMYIKFLLKKRNELKKEENIKHDKEVIITELKNNKEKYLFKNGKINCEKLYKAIGFRLWTGKTSRHLRNFIKKYLKKELKSINL